MGSGTFSASTFRNYSLQTKARGITRDGKVDLKGMSAQEVFKAREIDPALRIMGSTVRECRDSEEHPATVPVILALDVTGSMGGTSVEIASALGKVMTELYKSVKDVEFLIMAIGDFSYDQAPLQVSQFESDIRIAEHLDKVYFEGGGGGNYSESYTAAWLVGARHTDLDCWKRGKKGLIITIGDEQINPYLPEGQLKQHIGEAVQANIETKDLREEVRPKYELAHIHIEHGASSRDRTRDIQASCAKYDVPFLISSVDGVSDVIIQLVKAFAQSDNVATEVAVEVPASPAKPAEGDITW